MGDEEEKFFTAVRIVRITHHASLITVVLLC